MANVAAAVRRANVEYTLDTFQTGIPHVPPMVSNGVVGAWFDHFGFMERPDTGTPQGRTVLGYVEHYHRAEHGRHIQFPLAVVRASFVDNSPLNLVDCRTYRQVLDLYDGILTTTYDLYGGTTVTAFASQSALNLFVLRVAREFAEKGKALQLEVECDASACQNNDTNSPVAPVSVDFDQGEDGLVRVCSRTNATTTNWALHCRGAACAIDGTRVLLTLPFGATDVRVCVERRGGVCADALTWLHETLVEQHQAVWHSLWRTSWVDLPEDRAQAIWCRTKYYALSHFPSAAVRPMCPTGLAGNIWGFTFPQDVYYVAENLPRLGHSNRARAALTFWLRHVDDAAAYGTRLLGTEGAYYPWTPPFRDFDRYETDGVCGADSYELHNPVYVAAMVWHCFLATHDTKFLARHLPIIQEVFRFYWSIASPGAGGTFDLYHEKARGQDEASSTEGGLRNLLCVSYSAEYAARMLVGAAACVEGTDEFLLAHARELAAKGCTRQPLLRAEGLYATHEGDHRPLGKQKHPVQLNPIAFLPMPDMVERDKAVWTAWRRRYDLTINARKPLTLGWTLGEFALASSRMRSPSDLARDLAAVQPCRGADPRWIQFYESSFWEGWHLHKSYYLPMSGLYLQAFTDCLVQSWRGYVDLWPCLLPGWEKQRITFRGIRALGVLVDGTWNRGRMKVVLRPRGAESVTVRVSPDGRVTASGYAGGPGEFEGGTDVTFEFAGRRSVELRTG